MIILDQSIQNCGKAQEPYTAVGTCLDLHDSKV